MLATFFALALYVFSLSASASGNKGTKPACVSKCWTNSQYVSSCMGDNQCLCDDAEFQNAVYQCLYSQCQTAQFGSALHHALNNCAGHEQGGKAATTSSVPALLRQHEAADLKKRAGNMQSAHHTKSVTRGKPTQSVSASAYATYATQRAYPRHAGANKAAAAPEPTPKAIFGSPEEDKFVQEHYPHYVEKDL